MIRALSLVFSLMAVFTLSVSSATLIVDPGEPDQVIVGIDGIGPGELAVIPIMVSCDTDVGVITIPLTFDNSALVFDSSRFFGTLLDWDDVSVQERPGGTIITIVGWHDLGGGPNPPLNTSSDL